MSCEQFESRLIAGDRPADDAELGAHVGSCLRCFRTAADMREVPRLSALLRESEAQEGAGVPDPGAFFWEKFPGQVSAAWVSARVRDDRTRRWADRPTSWERVLGWLRRPVPAALAGAVGAVGLAVLVMGPGLRMSDDPRPGRTTAAGAFDIGAEIGSTLGSEIVAAPDDAIAELDLEGLTSLRDGLHRALDPEADSALSASDLDESAPATSSDPTTMAEDLEMLDETGLLALQERLR